MTAEYITLTGWSYRIVFWLPFVIGWGIIPQMDTSPTVTTIGLVFPIAVAVIIGKGNGIAGPVSR